MRRTRGLIPAAFVAALVATFAATAPAGAAGDYTPNGIGTIKTGASNCGAAYEVCIDTGAVPATTAKVWFGLRVFTTGPGTMVGHTQLKTTNAAMWLPNSTPPAGGFPCISDFNGTGTDNGSGIPAGALDPGIAMVGGFVGSGTGCSDPVASGSKLIKFDFNSLGTVTFAFYGAFYGTEAASWRNNVATATGHTQWWNLWGNFTSLASGSST